MTPNALSQSTLLMRQFTRSGPPFKLDFETQPSSAWRRHLLQKAVHCNPNHRDHLIFATYTLMLLLGPQVESQTMYLPERLTTTRGLLQ